VTSRAKSDNEGKEDFIHESKSTTVALTRAKEGLWVVGNMDYLALVASEQKDEPWMKMSAFIRLVANDAPPVQDTAYQRLLTQLDRNQIRPENITYVSGIIGIMGADQQPTSLIAECQIAKMLGWQPGSFTKNAV
jgi:hypothetical protein